jgi:diguanylate cyclase (GGDEF)-like protein/PAS domain S-box-containing protein
MSESRKKKISIKGLDETADLTDLFAVLLESIPGLFYLIDSEQRFRRWNSGFEQATGYSHEEISRMKATQLFAEEHWEAVQDAIDTVFQSGQASLEAPLIAKSGEVRDYSYFGRRVDIGGEMLVAGTGVDISRLKAAQREQARQSEQLRHLASNVPGVIYQLRRDAQSGQLSMPYASSKIFEVLGVHHEDVESDAGPLFDRLLPEDEPRVLRAMDISARQMTPFQEQFRIAPRGADPEHSEWVEVESSPEKQPDGSIIWHGFARLITVRRRMEDELTRLAYHDPLTDLPNRSWLQLLLEEQISDASLLGNELALLHLDIDNFKEINDIWGHGTGDRMLAELADRLRSVIADRARIGRLGGDEFLIMMQAPQAEEPASRLASALCAAMDAPLAVDGMEVRVTASVGISLFPEDGETAEDLLRHSDAALYRAKEDGTGSWALYTPELTAAAMARRYLETELRSAVEREEIRVALQPIVDLQSNEVTGYEALARWHHAQDGWIDPEQFIMLAESRGLVARLGEQVYAQAMLSMVKENRSGTLAINVAPMQLRDPQFARRLVRLCEIHGLPPDRLSVEITERAFMDGAENHLSQLDALRKHGINVVIDDFGTGYSSLAYLRQLPIQGLKVDRIFVQDVGENFKNAAIVKAVVTLSEELGIDVTAEGIQTSEELAIIRSFGCKSGQGWLFGRPQLVRQRNL